MLSHRAGLAAMRRADAHARRGDRGLGSGRRRARGAGAELGAGYAARLPRPHVRLAHRRADPPGDRGHAGRVRRRSNRGAARTSTSSSACPRSWSTASPRLYPARYDDPAIEATGRRGPPRHRPPCSVASWAGRPGCSATTTCGTRGACTARRCRRRTGTATRASLARLYAACVGEIDGVRLLAPRDGRRGDRGALRAAPTACSGSRSRFGLGFALAPTFGAARGAGGRSGTREPVARSRSPTRSAGSGSPTS